ncbi:baseplate J/gp47 family protein [Beijerinckia sp. L45]|uniref:baseplate J/gp47 family protein n=1 Tax=Beijerinckia sp. L45 TaxID=1641855 RepID=UPI00131D3D69|nr:baseplate J/gp47 family protein [Beijerinckia sp. L45]
MTSNNWTTPDLATVRANNRDYITSQIGAPLIPNDYPRVLADANAGNASLAYQFIQYLSLQILPDTATGVFLDKHATLYLVNADGSKGRKVATYASGTATMTATVAATILPAGSQFTALSGSTQIVYETTAEASIGLSPTTFSIRSLTAGVISNLAAGSGLTITSAVAGLNAGSGTVVSLTGGADEETDDELRTRVLARLSQPPMGGDASDYVAWALAVPGVTRAWCAPNEMGPGTVTIRIMCDDLRATSDPMTSGLPTAADLVAVKAYLDTVRPVTVADLFVCAPIPQPVSFTISNLTKDTTATRTAIAASVAKMIFNRARPATSSNGTLVAAKTISVAWVSDAILGASGVTDFDLAMNDFVPSSNGNIGVLGTILYG